MERLFAVAQQMARRVPAFILALVLPVGMFAEPELDVEGLGFFDNIRIQNLAKSLRSEESTEDTYDISFIENTLFLIDSRLEGEGHLNPSFDVKIEQANGDLLEITWGGQGLLELSPDLQARRVEIRVEKGLFYQYQNISFAGLTAIPAEEAQTYFFRDRFLLFEGGQRAFSPSRMKGSAQSLTTILQQMGYQNATVQASVVGEMDHETGLVDVAVVVNEGPRHVVQQVVAQLQGYEQAPGVEGITIGEVRPVNAPFSSSWRQDYGREMLHQFYKAGYPEARAQFEVVNRREVANEIHLDLLAKIQPGPRVRIAELQFENPGSTRMQTLRRRIQSTEGEWLDPLQLERDRFSIADLGVYDRVQADYEPLGAMEVLAAAEPPVVSRNVIFQLEPGERLEVDLLFGYGSYDQLRGGIEVTRYNLWGRGHRDSVLLVQSFVSTLAEYRYSMPEFFDINNTLNLRLRGLRREEISFRREEVGAEVRIARKLQSLAGATASVGYRLERVRAVGIETEDARETARVGALFGNFNLSRLDNPIFPEKGYQIRAEALAGSSLLGGQVNYQRVEVGGSWHKPISSSTIFHTKLVHGLLTTLTAENQEIPVSERFFPGGEDSIRGYTEGEASPHDDEGLEIGAESFALLTLELEQFLSESFSVVVFTDSLAQSKALENYLSDDFLVSVGLGLRYRTPVGPIRLEAGYNLARRDFDPSYSIHLSLGYPF